MPARNGPLRCSRPTLQNREWQCGKVLAGPRASRPESFSLMRRDERAWRPEVRQDSTRRRIERIARGADGADDVGVVLAVQRHAQAADMDVDGACLDIDVLAPHRIEQLLAREYAAGMLHEMAQQAELGGPEM